MKNKTYIAEISCSNFTAKQCCNIPLLYSIVPKDIVSHVPRLERGRESVKGEYRFRWGIKWSPVETTNQIAKVKIIRSKSKSHYAIIRIIMVN